MKLLIIVCVIFAAIPLSKQAMDRDKAIETFKMIAADCKAKTSASDADVDGMINHEEMATKEGTCLRACLMKQFSMLTQDGKPMKEGIIKMADMWTDGDTEAMRLADEISTECLGIDTGDDHCSNAHNYFVCLKKTAAARNVPIEW